MCLDMVSAVGAYMAGGEGGILHQDFLVQENFDAGFFCMQSPIFCGKFRTHML